MRLVTVKDLRTYFHTAEGVLPAVDGISFHIDRGETVGMVGESGCGKSVTSLSMLRLIPIPPGKIESGEILYDGEDLLKKSTEEIRDIRGNKISMIFQEVMTSLNPVLRIGKQIAEAIEIHQSLNPRQAMDKAVDILRMVGIPRPEKRIKDYPHLFSGGMRQRVMIAMAMVCNPELLIADEPTTALDVTIQAQVLELMKQLKTVMNTSILLISHDLGLVAEMAERVLVMYAGKIVEEAPVEGLFRDPQHPYTKGLLTSIPRLEGERGRLNIIRGVVPRPTEFPTGCRFHPRCDYARAECTEREPPQKVLDAQRRVSCWLFE
ncbi:MAG: ABC transporter ATP-binding protein [Spirochaetaceae bacterium]|nr:MAG: ABC transporter ATP-binding protein [Spirochaetaceae bacterium]